MLGYFSSRPGPVITELDAGPVGTELGAGSVVTELAVGPVVTALDTGPVVTELDTVSATRPVVTTVGACPSSLETASSRGPRTESGSFESGSSPCEIPTTAWPVSSLSERGRFSNALAFVFAFCFSILTPIPLIVSMDLFFFLLHDGRPRRIGLLVVVRCRTDRRSHTNHTKRSMQNMIHPTQSIPSMMDRPRNHVFPCVSVCYLFPRHFIVIDLVS